MNNTTHYRAIFLTFVLLIMALPLHAALPSSGEWPATNITTDETVNLTGNVVITGCIYIPANVTLTIRGAGQTITPCYNHKATMNWGDNLISFQVEGSLIIEGSAGAPIKIIGPNTASFGYDGSGNDVAFDGLVNSDYQYSNTSVDDGANYSSTVIVQCDYSSSNITLRYVDFKNIMHYAS